MTESAIRTKFEDERERVEALWRDATNNPTIYHGLAAIARGEEPGGVWRAVAVSLALECDSLRKMALRLIAVTPTPVMIFPAEPPSGSVKS